MNLKIKLTPQQALELSDQLRSMEQAIIEDSVKNISVFIECEEFEEAQSNTLLSTLDKEL